MSLAVYMLTLLSRMWRAIYKALVGFNEIGQIRIAVLFFINIINIDKTY
jgi:hypothetical protein